MKKLLFILAILLFVSNGYANTNWTKKYNGKRLVCKSAIIDGEDYSKLDPNEEFLPFTIECVDNVAILGELNSTSDPVVYKPINKEGVYVNDRGFRIYWVFNVKDLTHTVFYFNENNDMKITNTRKYIKCIDVGKSNQNYIK